MSVNKVFLLGNLGADPESRPTNNGGTVTTLRVATSSRVKDRDGNWTDETEWHRVVCFGRSAENAARYLRKGSRVHIEGKIRTNKWEDKDGNSRYTTEIIVGIGGLTFVGKNDGGSRSGGGGGGNGGYSGGGGGAAEDIPF